MKEDQTDKVLSMLEKNVYDDRNHFSVLWPYWNCIIEAVPEAEKDNTFILIFREEYLDRIKGLLSQVISYNSKKTI